MKNYIFYKIVNDDEVLVVTSRMQAEITKSAHERGHFALIKIKKQRLFSSKTQRRDSVTHRYLHSVYCFESMEK